MEWNMEWIMIHEWLMSILFAVIAKTKTTRDTHYDYISKLPLLKVIQLNRVYTIREVTLTSILKRCPVQSQLHS
jgi:hypothetical protein